MLRTVILLAVLCNCLASPAGRIQAAWTTAPVIEREPLAAELQAYPHDGQVVGVNPPGFCWTPNAKAAGYRLEVRQTGRTSGTFLSTPSQASTVYPPYQRLEPNSYEWQVVYLDEHGLPTGASKVRQFQVPATAPVLLMPDVAALKMWLSGVRPRLFLAGRRLQQLREMAARETAPGWPELRRLADAALKEPSYHEPAPPRPGAESSAEWRRIFWPGKVGAAHAARTALAYRITGEAKYREAARRWLLALAAWDPRGISSFRLPLANGAGNDEAAMPMLERMSLAWDWVGDQLTPEERKKVLASMRERGNQVLSALREEDFLSHPFFNHFGRVVAFLGMAGLAFLDDIPEAQTWLDYVLRAEMTSYPSFGGDEGGWAQGPAYWSHYIYHHVNFARALREATETDPSQRPFYRTETDLLQRPFYRNTGYFGLYFLPAYASRGGFGDGAYHAPNAASAVLLNALAQVHRDGVLKWQADEIALHSEKDQTPWREWAVEDLYQTLAAADAVAVRPVPPSKLDGSRHQADIGWVAMHSALGDAANDVWALFKSSRFGSFSHSHADQNSFQLSAYGRALAIDSGYYPSYGTPHDNLYTRQTRAHNAILVNRRGQAIHSWEASGRITRYERHGIVTIVRGEAADAYNCPQPEKVLLQWKERLDEPIPPVQPKVESFERTLVFVASPARPVLIVYDYVRTASETTFDWLLHALQRMETDGRSGAIRLCDGDARLAVRLLATVPYEFSQTDRFPVVPEIPENTLGNPVDNPFPNQWHLKGSTTRAAKEVKFLAVMVPYRASEPPPEIVATTNASAQGFRVAGTEVTAWWGAGPHGKMLTGAQADELRLVLKFTEDGKTSTVVSP